MDRNAQLKLVAKLRKRFQESEEELIAQNVLIAALERTGDDAKEARAFRAQLWVTQEEDLAEMERLLDEMDGLGPAD